MKFLLTALLLCICSVAAQEEYYGYYGGEPVAEPAAEDVYDEPYDYEGEDAVVAAEGAYYTERRRNRPTTEPVQVFAIS